MQITRTVETSTPVEKVFAYLSDFTNTEEWDPGTVSTSKVGGDGGEGTKYHNVSKFAGSKTELTYTVRTFVPDERFVIVGENKTVKATDTMSFTDTGHGTRVTYNAAFEFRGLFGRIAPLLSPVLGLAFKRLGDEAEKGLKTNLDKL